MRKGYILLITLTVAVMFGAGCKKSPKDNSAVTFVNRIDQQVTLNIYASANDYYNNTNPIQELVVASGENLSVPGSVFSGGGTFYMDWYTADYYYNNWFNDDYPIAGGNRVRISPTPGNNTYYLEPDYKGPNRNAFLNGEGTESNWLAVGAYLYSSSTGYVDQWQTITNDERYREITVRKDFKAAYKHNDKQGKPITDTLTFMVQQSPVPYIEFKATNGIAAGSMTGGKLPTASPPDYKSNAVDTVMALFPDSDVTYMMVRR